MAYILVQPEVLKSKGYDFFETMPDGRAIAETNLLKVLGSVKEVEIVSTTKELEIMIAKQKEEMAHGKVEDKAEEIPQESADENSHEDPSADAPLDAPLDEPHDASQENSLQQESEVAVPETEKAAESEQMPNKLHTNSKKVK